MQLPFFLAGEKRKIRIMLLAGGDLIASFGHPGVWAPDDVCIVLQMYLVQSLILLFGFSCITL
jgi:L-asparaginase II